MMYWEWIWGWCFLAGIRICVSKHSDNESRIKIYKEELVQDMRGKLLLSSQTAPDFALLKVQNVNHWPALHDADLEAERSLIITHNGWDAIWYVTLCCPQPRTGRANWTRDHKIFALARRRSFVLKGRAHPQTHGPMQGLLVRCICGNGPKWIGIRRRFYFWSFLRGEALYIAAHFGVCLFVIVDLLPMPISIPLSTSILPSSNDPGAGVHMNTTANWIEWQQQKWERNWHQAIGRVWGSCKVRDERWRQCSWDIVRIMPFQRYSQ